MTATPKSGVLETSTSTGTGDMLLAGAVGGYLALGSGDNALSYYFCAKMGTQWELFIGTYSNSPTRKITRDQVLRTSNDNTEKINWGNGTKEVGIVLAAERVACLDVANIWRSPQYFRGNLLYLDSDDDTYFDPSSDDVVILRAGGVELARFDGPNSTLSLWQASDSTPGGPQINLRRSRTSPAAGNVQGMVNWLGRDSGGSEVTYSSILSLVESATAGAVSGQVRIQTMKSGTMRQVFTVAGDHVRLDPSINFYSNAKTSSDWNAVGVEILANGQVASTTQDNTAITINRKGSDGSLIVFNRDGSPQGTISVAGTTVTYGAFTGEHPSEWAVPVGAEYEQVGTVVRTADGIYNGRKHLSLVMPTTTACDPRAYGVVAARIARDDDPHLTRLLIHALGTSQIRVVGPVKAGDLLESSDVPGCAQAQSDDLVHAYTIAKATQDAPPGDGPRLVPCVLMAG